MPVRTSKRRYPAWVLGLALATLVAGERASHASESEDPAETETSWYGWETVLSDLGGLGLGMIATGLDEAKYQSASRGGYETASTIFRAGSALVYFGGGPAVHLAHGHKDKAGISLGLRLGLPLAGMLSGFAIGIETCGKDGESEIPCPLIAGLMGGAAGFLGAMIIDAAVVAREPVGPAAGPRLRAAFVPSVGGGTFLVGGRF